VKSKAEARNPLAIKESRLLDRIEHHPSESPGKIVTATSLKQVLPQDAPIAGGHAGASAEAIRYHYDVGNDFFRLWLDPRLVYSAARWNDTEQPAASLEEAQESKLDFHLRAVDAASCRRLLDVGCGWGALLHRATTVYGVEQALGLTLSSEQAKFIEQSRWPGVAVNVVGYQSFELDVPVDGIVSIGAFEHFAKPGLSPKQKIATYAGFFRNCHRWLKPGGRLSLQTICWGGVQRDSCGALLPLDIFPESDIPFASEVLEAANDRFELVATENGREDYILTLQEWLSRLHLKREEILADFGGKDTFEFYDRYLRRAIAGFRRQRMTLLRFAFVKR
jgi:cyclopropane-fatty-acyl-phospholipid synthase